MLTFTRHQCRVTAFALLALFVGALGLLGACAVWCGPLHGTGAGQVAVAAAQAPAHSCCAKKAAEVPGKESKKAECCTHEKAAKWAAVPDGPLGELAKLAPAPLALPPVALNWGAARRAGTWAVAAPVRLVPPRHLPPKILDLRVFLRSLTV
ncbi:MAG: hypothetical protein H7330_00290 [Hymenobacteraceae bacterium]|nr:hypothetical protein [Hymenobacteraceae bacterium]